MGFGRKEPIEVTPEVVFDFERFERMQTDILAAAEVANQSAEKMDSATNRLKAATKELNTVLARLSLVQRKL